MRRGEWIKRSLLALMVLMAGDAPLVATPLDKAACSALVSELETLVSTGLRDDIERGPEWAKKNLPDERVRSALRLLEIEDQIEFRCHKRYWPARPEQTAIPLPQRAPDSIRPKIAQPAVNPLSPPNVGADNRATDQLMAAPPIAEVPAEKTPAAQSAPAALSAATDPVIAVPERAPPLAPLVSGSEMPAKQPGNAKKSRLPPESLVADRAKKVAALDGIPANPTNPAVPAGAAPLAKPGEPRAVRAFKPAAVNVPTATAARPTLARLVVADDPFIEVPSAQGEDGLSDSVAGPASAALGGVENNHLKSNRTPGQSPSTTPGQSGSRDLIELPVTKPALPKSAAVPAGDQPQADAPTASKAKQQRRRSANRGYVPPDEVTPYALPGMRF